MAPPRQGRGLGYNGVGLALIGAPVVRCAYRHPRSRRRRAGPDVWPATGPSPTARSSRRRRTRSPSRRSRPPTRSSIWPPSTAWTPPAPGRSTGRAPSSPSRGVAADYRGARPEYAQLLKEAGYKPIELRKPTHVPSAVSLLSRGRRIGRDRGPRPRRGRELPRRAGRDDHPPPAFSDALAVDGDGLPSRDVLAAKRADHRADQLSGRRDRHPAGNLPARASSARGPTPSISSACWACANSRCL